MALELRVPAERIDPPKDVELRPKQAKALVESLTFQGLPTIRKVLADLATFNRVKLLFEDRLQLLEAYRPIVLMILDDVDSGLAKSSPQGESELLKLARELATELAYGYKILILEKYGKLLAFGARKQLPFLVFRAMDCLAQLLRLADSSYTRVPEGTWREIHRLFLLAEKEGIALEIADAEGKVRICDLYTEALLVALADPHRLAPGEVERVVQVIRTHRSPFAIGQDRPTTPPGGHFLVPCDQDQPPRPLRSVNDDPGGPNWRLFDANAVVDKVRAHRQALETGNVSAATSKAAKAELPALLAKLETLWGEPPRRQSQRESMDTSVALCAGLRAVTHFVTNEPRIDRRKEQDAIRRGITLPLVTIPRDDLSRELNVAEWVVVDQGDHGLKVHRDGPSSAPGITVGELVGIKSIGKARWAIGVVRRITLGDGGETELGIELLASAATSVLIRPVFNNGSPPHPGLLLAEQDDYAGAARLLAPPPTYSDLREFDVEDNDRFARVRATSLVERTDRFELFHVVPS